MSHGACAGLTAWVCIYMLISMRTTVVVDDELFKQAKRRAAALNTTLSGIVNQALRESLSKPVTEAPAFHMITFGNPKARVHREPADFATLIEEEDRHSVRR
ncbi:MAG TPA: type II toxin-antitoxin system VapB family antitoxin [Candidatus Margulisiibacteriota bacterium]|nr:type II toxin-antitoxin system VapB family antitoxin [Candidatus Margulisiibacteriota bacterium]